jgi:acyl-homoserine lactone acylase PvdQ
MIRGLRASVTLLVLLGVAGTAHAAQSDVSRYVLPPGDYGGIPTGQHSLDQLPLYSGLTPLRRNVSMNAVRRFYLPMNFRPIGSTQVQPVGRSDVTVTYDAYGIPHIDGTTRAGMMFGAGWVMARDRGLLLQFGRNPARAAVADIPGIDAFSLVTSATPFQPSAQAEALVTSERQALVRAYGSEGQQMLADFANYTDGINAYYTSNHIPIPGGRPFDANDVIAVTAFIGSIFGNGGGTSHETSDLLARLEQKFGAKRGHAMWNDAMEANDPDAPVTTHKSFSYPELTGGKVRGSVVVDPGSIQLAKNPATGAARAAEAPRPHASNWQLVAPSRSDTGRALGVMGPQLGYYYPEIVYQEQLQGPGINAQGAAVAGLGLYILIGRTRNYAWSLTSADNANEDVFADRLCEPGGGMPTRTTQFYIFRGQCRPMSIFDAGSIGGKEITFPMTVHGPVIGTATVHGQPYALTRKRSTYGQDVLSLGALKAMTEGRGSSPQKFWKFANRFGFTFNWGYINRTASSFFSSGKLPIRAKGIDRELPTLGTGRYEWRGFLPELAHPHDVGGPNDLLLNWNNKAAPGWMHGDDAHFGSVQRVELFGPFPRRPRINDVVGVMNKAATQDRTGVLVWPVIRSMLGHARAPDANTARAVKLIDNWVRNGAPTVGSPPGGPIPYAGAALLNASWPHIFDAVMGPRLKSVLGPFITLLGRDPSYVDKDLRTELGQRVLAPYSVRYCGRGKVRACARSLWAAIRAGRSDLVNQHGAGESAWRINQGMTGFVPHLIPTTFPTTNRPTYQQVISLARKPSR